MIAAKRKGIDKFFLMIVVVILLSGFAILGSASMYYSAQRFGDSLYYLRHQVLFGGLMGLGAFLFLQAVSYQYWKRLSLIIFLGSLALLLAVFIPGIGFEQRGALRWLQITPSFIFQPAEVVKLSFIIYLAAWLASKKRQIHNFKKGFLPFAVFLGMVGVPLIVQPDFSSFMIISVVSVAMFYLAGGSLRHLILTGLLGLILATVLVVATPYRLDRLLTFLEPARDPLGSSYQLRQAIISIGSGGMFGVGFGQSIQKQGLLPESMTDSIFAVLMEELGFVGGVALIGAYILLATRGLKIALQAPDSFGYLLVSGIVSLIIFQAFVNIMSMSGLIPLTGTTLPLVSYGSSSLAVALAGLGIILNVSRYRKE